MIGLLLAVWITGRSVLWEDPFPLGPPFANASPLMAFPVAGEPSQSALTPALSVSPALNLEGAPKNAGRFAAPFFSNDQGAAPSLVEEDIAMAMAHQVLWRTALATDPRHASRQARQSANKAAGLTPVSVPIFPGSPPFDVAVSDPEAMGRVKRWSLGAWAFARRGPTGTLIAPGPAPVYGASQAGAVLQYRLDPANSRDPRAYLRATRALIEDPESEVAAGVSARPFAKIPVRVAGEVRASDNAFGQRVRPAAFAISELPPVVLPLRVTAEMYAAAGYVGGRAGTAFAEGQATLTRGLTRFDLAPAKDIRVSVGAGAWGGAQQGVHRLDLGPTLRLDMALGQVPARVSIDYRERVEGKATPNSGIAATLSTQF